MKIGRIRKLISGTEHDHFNIPDQAYRRDEQHNLVSIKLVHDILYLIHTSDDFDESFLKVKDEISKQLNND